ncbi:MAG: hypothetical protein IJI87_00805, partial [Mogibacterium sp.]|nr:hypothetical protein [Mogibacterium sp.]
MRNNRNNMMNRCRYAMSTVPGVDRDTLRTFALLKIINSYRGQLCSGNSPYYYQSLPARAGVAAVSSC